MLVFAAFLGALVMLVVCRDWLRLLAAVAATSATTLWLVFGMPPLWVDALAVVGAYAGLWWLYRSGGRGGARTIEQNGGEHEAGEPGVVGAPVALPPVPTATHGPGDASGSGSNGQAPASRLTCRRSRPMPASPQLGRDHRRGRQHEKPERHQPALEQVVVRGDALPRVSEDQAPEPDFEQHR